MAKPQPPANASAWEVWQYICGMLGVLSYIDKDTCVVTTDAALYATDDDAPAFIQGENVSSFEQTADTAISGKAILLKSFDPLRGVQLEAIYPPPGDVRVKTPRAVARRALKTGAPVNANDISKELEEYFRFDIHDQATLEQAARDAYSARSRQELTGSFKTAEMRVENAQHDVIDVLSMGPGDSVRVGIDLAIADVRSITTGAAEQIAYLTDRLGYDEGLAALVVANITADEISNPRYHVSRLDVHLGPEAFEIGVSYVNVIQTER